MAEVAIDASVFTRRLKKLYEHWEVRQASALARLRDFGGNACTDWRLEAASSRVGS